MPSCWAIVVAGGSGSRFGAAVPKQYASLRGRRILDWSLAAMAEATGGNVVLVVPTDRLADPEPLAALVVAGGSTRADSVRCGLAAVPGDAEVVFVHDAARPCVPAAVCDALVAAVARGADGAVPGVALADTIKRVSDGVVIETVPRAELVAVQTPQVFRSDVLRRVNADAADATDDAGLVERSGGTIRVVGGSPLLRKVTESADLALLDQLLEGCTDRLLGESRTEHA